MNVFDEEHFIVALRKPAPARTAQVGIIEAIY